MDAVLFESLLYEEEGVTLDFKRDQYRFTKASLDEKAELLKDLLGFSLQSPFDVLQGNGQADQQAATLIEAFDAAYQLFTP